MFKVFHFAFSFWCCDWWGPKPPAGSDGNTVLGSQGFAFLGEGDEAVAAVLMGADQASLLELSEVAAFFFTATDVAADAGGAAPVTGVLGVHQEHFEGFFGYLHFRISVLLLAFVPGDTLLLFLKYRQLKKCTCSDFFCVL